jgi:uncharacterized protein YxeA
MKKDDVIAMIIMILLMIMILALFIWKFNQTSKECDKENGYQCSASQVFQYNKKVD